MHQFCSGLPEFAVRLDFVDIRIGIFDQSWRNSHLPQEFAFGAFGDFRRHGANLRHQSAQRFFIRIVGWRNSGVLQQRSQIADFFMRLREQVSDLRLQRARVDDLPQ